MEVIWVEAPSSHLPGASHASSSPARARGQWKGDIVNWNFGNLRARPCSEFGTKRPRGLSDNRFSVQNGTASEDSTQLIRTESPPFTLSADSDSPEKGRER